MSDRKDYYLEPQLRHFLRIVDKCVLNIDNYLYK